MSGSSDNPKPESTGSASGTEDETKRLFREALAAKQARQGEDHLDAPDRHVHGHGPVSPKRTFRRKTG